MATCRLVINTALRQLGVLGAGREARTTDAAECLAALESLYMTWIDGGAFGRLSDVVAISPSYTAVGNERIVRPDASFTVILPEFIADRAGWYGCPWSYDGDTVSAGAYLPLLNATTPRDGAPVVMTDSDSGTLAVWLHSGTLKTWERLDALQMDSAAPRSTDFQGLAANLAPEVAALFGTDPTATVTRQAARYAAAMTQQRGMREQPTAGVYF